MLLAIGVTLAGLPGGGPVSLWTPHAKAGALDAGYSPVIRFGMRYAIIERDGTTSIIPKEKQ